MNSLRPLSSTVVVLLCLGRVFAAEGRIPIYQAGTITTPGHYFVTQNLTGSGAAPVIDITAYDVDLDLNGFVLNNGAGPAPVIRASLVRRVAIRNGTIAGGGVGLELGEFQMVVENVTVSDSGGYGISITNGAHHVIRNVAIDATGSDAIYLNDTTTLVDNVRIRYATGHGIHVQSGFGTTVSNSSIEFVTLNGIYFDGSRGSAAVNNGMENVSGEGIRIAAIGVNARAWNNRVASASHAIHISGGSSGSIMRNTVRSNSGHGIFVQAGHTVVEGNQADSCPGFGLYLAAGSNFSTYGRNAMQENQGTLATCSVGPPNPNFCNEGGGNVSFGDNLMPGLQ